MTDLTDAQILALKTQLGDAIGEAANAAVAAWFAALPSTNPTPDPQPDLEPHNLTATPGDGKIVLTWQSPAGGTPTGYLYGRDGTDTGGAGPWTSPVPLPADARTATLDKLTNGRAYTVTLAAVYPTGAVTVTATATPIGPVTPVPDPPPVTPPSGRAVKLVGHSGMPFNITLFNGGDTTQAAMKAQAANVGIAMFDGGLSFATRDAGWDAVRDDNLVAQIKAVLDGGGLFILSLPHSLDGDSLMNQKGAANAYKAQQVAFGQWLVSKGLNQAGLILRLDWESNGGWYHWSAAAPGGVPALRDAMKLCIDNLRAGGLTLARFDLCLNMPSAASSHTWADLWPGPGYWSVFSIDGYDAYPGVRSHADWEAKQGDTHSLRGALAQGAKLSTTAWPVMAGQDEGGNWHAPDGAGDNPTYWVELLAELMKAPGRVAWLNIYNDRGAPANLLHDFADNPKAFAAVRAIVAGILARA